MRVTMSPMVSASSRAGMHTLTRRPRLADWTRPAGKSAELYERCMRSSCHDSGRFPESRNERTTATMYTYSDIIKSG
jgi:hypothetical protein